MLIPVYSNQLNLSKFYIYNSDLSERVVCRFGGVVGCMRFPSNKTVVSCLVRVVVVLVASLQNMRYTKGWSMSKRSGSSSSRRDRRLRIRVPEIYLQKPR